MPRCTECDQWFEEVVSTGYYEDVCPDCEVEILDDVEEEEFTTSLYEECDPCCE